jgi:hypothetical protein
MAGSQHQTLREAAVVYAAAVELEGDSRVEWDLLRKAALRYAAAEKRKGRPRKTGGGEGVREQTVP